MSNTHEYWLAPPAENTPEMYLPHHRRSEYLLSEMEGLVPKDASILEVGCNVGRNLHHLHHAGYQNLTGIEINPGAVTLMRKQFPELDNAEIVIGPMETILPTLEDQSFDFVFTMVVLVHLPRDREANEEVHYHLARITKGSLMHIEFEHWTPGTSYRNFKESSCQPTPGAVEVFHGAGMTTWIYDREPASDS